MEYIICLIGILIALIILYILMGTKLKNIKDLRNKPEYDDIANKLPHNLEIGKEILKYFNNDHTQIQQEEGTQTLYVATSDKIFVASEEKNYTRIQTMAHECIHSMQPRTLLLFHFIFSNIYLIANFIIIVLTVFGILPPSMEILNILLIMAILNFTIKIYLELDAMTKAPFITEKILKKYTQITENEKQELLHSYENVNNMAIPYAVINLLFSICMPIIIYIIVAFFMC